MEIGDLVTLKGMSKTKEKPLGIIMKKWFRGSNMQYEIFWLTEQLAKRYAIGKMQHSKKLDVVNSAHQQS
jgi:hypothetical protein